MANSNSSVSALPAFIDFTSRDFAGYKLSLIEFLKQKYPEDYQDFVESALGVAMLELAAYGFAVNSFAIDRGANETYIEVIRERRNMVGATKLIGYTMSLATAASADLVIQTADIATYETVTIAKGQVLTAGTAKFEVLVDYTLSYSAPDWIVNGVNQGSGSTISISASEGQSYNESFTSDGSPFQRMVLSNVPVIDGTVEVVIGGVTWLEVDSLVLGDPDDSTNQEIYEVKINEDDQASISFGDNNTGNAPARGVTVEAAYRTGGGSEGNVAANAISQPVEVVGTPTGGGATQTISLDVANTVAASGGAPRESIETARFFAPEYVKTNDRAITFGDYVTLSNGYTDGSNGTVAKAGVICDPSDGLSNLVSVYVWTADDDNVLVASPAQSLLDALASFLEGRKVATVAVAVVPGYNRSVNVTARIRVNSRFTSADVVTAVESVIDGLFKESRVRHENELRSSWIYDEIMAVPGVDWCHVTAPDPAILTDTLQSLGAGTLPTQTAGGTGTSILILPTNHTSPSQAVSTVDDFYCNYRVRVNDGGVIETRRVVSYVGSTKTLTVENAWDLADPASADTYELFHPRLVRLESGASAVDDTFVSRVLTTDSGTGSGQARFVLDYDGTEKIATLNSDWSVYPDATTTYSMLPDLRARDSEALVKGTVTVTVVQTQTSS